jgi:hypothetical protein
MNLESVANTPGLLDGLGLPELLDVRDNIGLQLSCIQNNLYGILNSQNSVKNLK